MSSFSLGFDAASLIKLAKLARFKALLDPGLEYALYEAGEVIAQTAQMNTWLVFDNPTGALADSIGVTAPSATEVDITSGEPYWRRRERGFEGMYDSLGRGPFHDPAKPYLQPAVDTELPAIQAMFGNAITVTWGSI